MSLSEVHNIDCMEYMRTIPDKFFELAICDPNYGIGAASKKINHKRTKPSRPNSYSNYLNKHKVSNWDDKRPEPDYFMELFRVSGNQIIFGANYLCDMLPGNYGWVFWNKLNGEGNDFSDGEFAFTSKGVQSRIINLSQFDGLRGGKDRIHPTQKPIALYKWLLQNYAKQGDKILDTHLGSGSSRIAAYDMGFDFYATELDEDYFKAQEKRFKEHCILHGNDMFKPVQKEIPKQNNLFDAA